MPIKGLTDSTKLYFPRIGKLRKGSMKGAKGPGKELPHWRFVAENEDPLIQEAFEHAYGPEPVSLSVYLPFRGLTDNWDTWMEKWAAGGLQHRCNGETTVVLQKPDGTYTTDPHPCPGGCSRVGRLSVILPEMFKQGYVGIVTVLTSGKHDLQNITETLNFILDTRRDEGLSGILFTLARVAEQVSTPPRQGTTNRTMSTKYNIRLTPAVEWVQASLALAATGQSHMLTDGRAVSTITGEIASSNDWEDPEDDDESEEPVTVGTVMAQARHAEYATKAKTLQMTDAVKKGLFLEYAKEFAKSERWLTEKNFPDYNRIAAALVDLGYTEITAKNVAEAFVDLATSVTPEPEQAPL